MFGQIEDSIVQQAWAQVPARPPAQTRAALRAEAKQLLHAQGAVLVAHYYVDAELQTLAEETGGCVSDSLEMARFGRDHEAETLVVAGVRFMGETAKILSPEKRVLMPDLDAECSLDLGCPSEAFIDFKRQHPDRTVVVYANTSAEIKAEADWVVTSSIALPIVEHLKARGEKILWAPDQHLGSYIQTQTGADMIHWQGACVVHDEFKGAELQAMLQRYPNAKVLVHPESPKEVVALADAVGSTSQLLDAPEQLGGEYFIVATDSGIFHKMQERYPDKTFVAAPTAGSSATCKSCAFCPWMALNGLQNLVDVLKSGDNEIFVDEAIRLGACRSLDRMLDFSREYKRAQQRDDFQPGIGPA